MAVARPSFSILGGIVAPDAPADFLCDFLVWTSQGNSMRYDRKRLVGVVSGGQAATKTAIFGAVRAIANQVEANEQTALALPPPIVVADPKRYDATLGTPTQLAAGNTPPDTGQAPAGQGV